MSENEYVSVEQLEAYLEQTLDESTNEQLLYVSANDVATHFQTSNQHAGQALSRHQTRSESFDVERRTNASRGGNSKWEIKQREIEREMTCPYPCPKTTCSHSFRSMQALEGHLSTHMDELMAQVEE
jgi:hypothetical protein